MTTILLTTSMTLALCGIGVVANGQTFSEWFFQKKTRMKYLRQQAAALESLLKTVREGYARAQDKIDQSDMEEGQTVRMDEDWFSSLKKVKPCFKESEKVTGLYRTARAIIDISDKSMSEYEASEWLLVSEKNQVIKDLFLGITDTEEALRKLQVYITDGKVEMTDDQRWCMIDELSRHVQLLGRLQVILIMQTNGIIEGRQEQAANDGFLRAYRP